MSSTREAEPPPTLAGRSAVVTGASRGIGLEIADALHRAGARLVVLARTVPAMRDTARQRGWADSFDVVAVDLADTDSARRAAATARAHVSGTPDILVNNAAEFYVTPAHETSLEDFERTLAVNLTSHFALIREFLPGMRARGSGHLVTIGSIADHVPLRGNVAYAASKYALRGTHEVLRKELGGSGVRATLVSPARVDTDIWNQAGPVEPHEGMLAAGDVAAAVMFALAQPATVNVDEIRLSRA